MNQTNGSVCTVSSTVSGVRGGVTNPAEQAMPSEQADDAMDGTSKAMERELPAIPRTPEGIHRGSARALQAYIERRKRLADRIRAEHPYFSETEFEERLEQFGA
jgi:hypothetical protein